MERERRMACVLVVDDNAGIRKLLSAVLQQAFHEPVLAADGQEALQVYRELKPTLVIVDVFLPKLDGIKTITALRRESTTVKVIAISGGPRAGRLDVPHAREYNPLEDAKRAGADIALSKPFDAAVIREAVQEVLARAGCDETSAPSNILREWTLASRMPWPPAGATPTSQPPASPQFEELREVPKPEGPTS